MAFRFRKTPDTTVEKREPSGGWYADPYGAASRRWYDDVEGWTDRVQGEGLEPDKTGMARVDAATESADGQAEHEETTGSTNGRVEHAAATASTNGRAERAAATEPINGRAERAAATEPISGGAEPVDP